MRAFIIITNNSPSKNGMLLSMLSAFGSIESIGVAQDVVEAVGIIQLRHPNTLIFTRRIVEEKEQSYLASILETDGSFIMIPNDLQFKDRCIYIGIDFSVAEQIEWVLNKIGETLHEYQHFIAK
ncbi:MAG TPA: hypothetical protein VLD55_01220 [Candidatus Sulfobium mesophilum]|nr:hypothetical protein [Candidatus Sulfobium mesophilum]